MELIGVFILVLIPMRKSMCLIQVGITICPTQVGSFAISWNTSRKVVCLSSKRDTLCLVVSTSCQKIQSLETKSTFAPNFRSFSTRKRRRKERYSDRRSNDTSEYVEVGE